MAPEMRRFADKADGLPADVFSFAKTLWIALTSEELGFDGQYAAGSDIALKNFYRGMCTTTLDEVLTECTRNDPAQRPGIEVVAARLREWLELAPDFDRRNAAEWIELMQLLFPLGTPERAARSDIDAICTVLNEIGKVPGLNHMFFPDGGGNTITNASRAGEKGFIAMEALGTSILKPLKLTFESFGLDSHWNYFRLEAEKVAPTGKYEVDDDDYDEPLTELKPGVYGSPDLWDYQDYDEERKLPKTARPVVRYLKG
jgi:serine/threonine-protein kinase